MWLIDYLNKQAVRDQPAEDRNREEAEAKAAVWIQNDLGGELRQQAQWDRVAQQRREEDEQWRQDIAARKARKLARAQREAQAQAAASSRPPQAASSS